MPRTLILGGTAWLGHTVAAKAVTAGHDVTAFARGTGAIPAGVRLVCGDRTDGDSYAALGDERWDLVVDVARHPLQVRTALAALAPAAERWVFISTGSVYQPDDRPFPDESTPTVDPVDEPTEPEHYGPGKVACEHLVAGLGDRAVIARAGLIGGAGDLSDRFGYYAAAFARAGNKPVLVPDIGDRLVQAIGVNDLADWILRAGADPTVSGAFDLAGEPVAFDELLAITSRVAGHRGELVAVDEPWLAERGVGYFMGPRSLPLWLPADHPLGRIRRSERAVDAGLTWSGYEQLTIEALADERRLGLDRSRRAGLTTAEAAELLAAWSP